MTTNSLLRTEEWKKGSQPLHVDEWHRRSERYRLCPKVQPGRTAPTKYSAATARSSVSPLKKDEPELGSEPTLEVSPENGAEDEALFGSHLREAARILRTLLSR